MRLFFTIAFFLEITMLVAQTCQEKEHIDYSYSDIIECNDQVKEPLAPEYSDFIKKIIRGFISDNTQHKLYKTINNIPYEISIKPNHTEAVNETHITLLSSGNPNIHIISKTFIDTIKHIAVFKNNILFEFDNFNITSLYYNEDTLLYQDVNCEYFKNISIYRSNSYIIIENQNANYNLFDFTLSVYNITGGLLFSKDIYSLSADKAYIPLNTNLSNGIYIFNLKSKACSVSYKINFN